MRELKINYEKIGCIINNVVSLNFFPVLILTLSAQGAVIVSQILLVMIVSPSELGIIRALESSLSIIILIASLGSQALSIREVAVFNNYYDKAITLRDIYLIVLIGGLVVILGMFFIKPFMGNSSLYSYLLTFTAMIFLTNMLRATTGFSQGAGMVKEIYQLVVGCSLIGILIQLLLTHQFGIHGWILGRCFSEFITLIATYFKIEYTKIKIPWLAPININQFYSLMLGGISVNSALILRVVIDNLPIMILAFLKVSTDQIGFFGLAILVVSSATLPMAIASQYYLPLLVPKAGDLITVKHNGFRLRKIETRLAIYINFSLTLAAIIIYFAVGGLYTDACIMTGLLAFTIPLKGMALANGTLLMAMRFYNITFMLNLIEGIICILLGVLLTIYYGVYGLIASLFISNLFSAFGYIAAVQYSYQTNRF
jgi:O-antigen/teichoic acid export membrane protein